MHLNVKDAFSGTRADLLLIEKVTHVSPWLIKCSTASEVSLPGGTGSDSGLWSRAPIHGSLWVGKNLSTSWNVLVASTLVVALPVRSPASERVPADGLCGFAPLGQQSSKLVVLVSRCIKRCVTGRCCVPSVHHVREHCSCLN